MDKITEGLYEEVINKKIDKIIEENKNEYDIDKEKIDKEEAAKIFSDYLTNVIKTGLNNIKDDTKKKENSFQRQIKLINSIVQIIVDETENDDLKDYFVKDLGEQLFSVYKKKNNLDSVRKQSKKKNAIRPETSISQSSLFTGALKEPNMLSEFKKEIVSSNRIDLLVSFIRWSGLIVIIDELRDFTENGGHLRVITTSYMGATEAKAVQEIANLPNTEIKISYDTKMTRLHAKSYIFHRDTGFTTAYVGSSNISKAALTSGLEWNVKLTKKELPETIEKIEATFETYWNSSEFEYYDKEKNSLKKLKDAIVSEKKNDKYLKNRENRYLLDIRPYSYQQEVLDRLEAEREVRGNYKNLVVAATGVGKTCISAFDYRNFIKKNPKKKNRLLFVAHREEILKQSIETFRAILKDYNFGDLFVGNYEPESLDHLFISIQTFNSRDFIKNTSKDYYDYIIIDEFHHAASKSYKSLLNHYKPKILLGLTATPERMDGKHNELYKIFNDRIASEIRLPEAIDRGLLCPFQYFGVTDIADLDDIKFSKSTYDIKELENIYTMNKKISEKRADLIINSTEKYVSDINEVKGLGFCVSIKHAEFMSNAFNRRGIKSIYLTGESKSRERISAKEKLVNGEINFIFVVDLYNEGVDIPEVNTILFLRPTESMTVFLQQLGRGLRLADNKDCLTVLDFIANANKKYNFENKFLSLTKDREKSISTQIKEGFTSLPKGCYIKLEKKASEYIYNNIRNSISTKSGLLLKIKSFKEDSELELNLKNFIDFYHMNIEDIYSKGSFYRLLVTAGLRTDFDEEYEEEITNSFKKFMHIDSRRFIKFLLRVLRSQEEADIKNLDKKEIRLLNMFNVTMWHKDFEKNNFIDEFEGIRRLKKSKNMCKEFIEILEYKYETISFVDKHVDLDFDCPLDLHCNYTRDQILLAFDHMKPSNVREGVKYIEDKKVDIFFITLNKSDKDYSPTTMYKDYSINEFLFHWQSQSNTSSSSKTGQRYINHRNMNSKVVLFVREHKNNKKLNIADSYTFLGKAEFVSYKGSKPMNIIWKLEEAIPSNFINKTNKLVAR
ncbi:DEAD/DEAH box helicase [Peptostreptococcus russellii]|uniref:DEAD/DEAH box helicase n=1 Tax=Peptostreptococcus russellii TaxID=215200 RepID=UPI0026F133D6|nr:DEAD/DEAH box helicase [Peptostreptococcus russellii]